MIAKEAEIAKIKAQIARRELKRADKLRQQANERQSQAMRPQKRPVVPSADCLDGASASKKIRQNQLLPHDPQSEQPHALAARPSSEPRNADMADEDLTTNSQVSSICLLQSMTRLALYRSGNCFYHLP